MWLDERSELGRGIGWRAASGTGRVVGHGGGQFGKLVLAAGECIDDVRVELRAGSFQDGGDRRVVADGVFVDPPGGEGIVDVGNSGDAGRQRNGVAACSIGFVTPKRDQPSPGGVIELTFGPASPLPQHRLVSVVRAAPFDRFLSIIGCRNEPPEDPHTPPA